MAEYQLSIATQCKECGSTELSIPDDADDNSPVSCKACGIVFGTYGALRAKSREVAKDHVQQQLRDIFKGSKSFKVK